MALSDRLNDLMTKKRISQRELEQLSGVPQGTISRILRGKIQNPSIDILKKLSKAIGTTVDYLISDPSLDELIATDDRAQHLLKVYADLSEEQKAQLYAFARFLHGGISRSKED